MKIEVIGNIVVLIVLFTQCRLGPQGRWLLQYNYSRQHKDLFVRVYKLDVNIKHSIPFFCFRSSNSDKMALFQSSAIELNSSDGGGGSLDESEAMNL